MHGLKTLLASLAAALFALTALPAMAQPREIEAVGDWTPDGIDVTFPDRIGEYERVRIVEYGPDDWSAGYTLIRNDKLVNAVTIYVYRTREGESCDDEFRGSQQALTNANMGASLISESQAASPSGTRAGTARIARYSFKAKYDGVQQTVRSDLYLYCKPGTRWWVKARSTWPEREPMENEPAMLMRAIVWPSNVAD
ncbi:MAG: hypothetical protein ACAH11_06260 [Sphingomonas sp.]